MKTPNTHELPPALRASIDKAAREAAASFHGAGQRSIWTAFRSAVSSGQQTGHVSSQRPQQRDGRSRKPSSARRNPINLRPPA